MGLGEILDIIEQKGDWVSMDEILNKSSSNPASTFRCVRCLIKQGEIVKKTIYFNSQINKKSYFKKNGRRTN